MIEKYFSATHVADLSRFSGFTVSGPDANTFLQGQLTNDVTGLGLGGHQRSGYCTPKGRLLATMLQWRIDDQTLGHLIASELLEPTVKRLKMFVLRSKLVFSDATKPLRAFGLWGSAASGLAPGTTIALADSGAWLLIDSPCPVLGARAWCILSVDHEAQIGQLLTQHEQRPQAAWMFSEIQNAKAWVGEPTTEAFVPQMINFELTNGVSFTKGCYPGQEVVARSQYLGKLKRRSFRAQLSETSLLSRSLGLTSDSQTDPSAAKFNLATYAQGLVGKDVWSASSSHEACGLVVNAAPVFSALGVQLSAIDLLIETSLDAWAKQDLHVGAIDGPSLDAQPMPYEFPAAE